MFMPEGDVEDGKGGTQNGVLLSVQRTKGEEGSHGVCCL